MQEHPKEGIDVPKYEMKFREEITNVKGLRPIPIELHGGKVIDWNMLARPEKQAMKKVLKKKMPKIWAKIEKCRKIKIYCEPMKENVYYCDKCNKTHVSHDLDEGVTPMFIECHHCKWPQAKSLGYKIPDSYKGAAPDIIFRYPTKEEYETAPDVLKDYLEQGGLFMEIVK